MKSGTKKKFNLLKNNLLYLILILILLVLIGVVIGLLTEKINITIKSDVMPLLYVIAGGIIGSSSGVIIQIIAHRQELKKSTFEKMKKEEIEAYKHLVGKLNKMRLKIHIVRNLEKAYKQFMEMSENIEKLTMDDIYEVLSLLPPQLKTKFTKEHKKTEIIKLDVLIRDQSNIEGVEVENIYYEFLEHYSVFSLFVDKEIRDLLRVLNKKVTADPIYDYDDDKFAQWDDDLMDLLEQLKMKMRARIYRIDTE
jgi:hypothetical protein